MPFDKITEISSDGEILVRAESLGWTWSLRNVEVEGFPAVRADMRDVVRTMRAAVESRMAEINRDKRERKSRIESFNSTRRSD